MFRGGSSQKRLMQYPVVTSAYLSVCSVTNLCVLLVGGYRRDIFLWRHFSIRLIPNICQLLLSKLSPVKFRISTLSSLEKGCETFDGCLAQPAMTTNR